MCSEITSYKTKLLIESIFRKHKNCVYKSKEIQELAELLKFVRVSQNGSHIKYYYGPTDTTIIISVNKTGKMYRQVHKQLKETFEFQYPKENEMKSEMLIPRFIVNSDSPWHIKVREFRSHHHKSAQDIVLGTLICASVYRKIELQGRPFTEDEYKRFCKYFSIDDTEEFKRILKIPVIENRIRVRVPKQQIQKVQLFKSETILSPQQIDEFTYNLSIKLERFKELSEIISNAEKIKEEYETLKDELAPIFASQNVK